MADAPQNVSPIIIACLRNQPLDLSHPTDWSALLANAQTHGVLLLLYESLNRAEVEIPPFFQSAVAAQWASAQTLAAGLESTLALLIGIDVMPLKGPILAESLYGDIALRFSCDLDLLVRRDDFNRAESILLENGFTPVDDLDDYHRMFTRDGLFVELHYDLASPRGLSLNVDGVWNRSVPAEFRGHAIRAMSTSDQALFLCLHGLKHGFASFVWIADLVHALNHADLKQLFHLARQEHLEPALFVACEVVRATLGLPPEIAALLDRHPEQVETAHRAAKLLLDGAIPTMGGPEIWSFYLQLETGARQKWRRRLTFFTPTVEDYKCAAHFRIPTIFVPVLRPLRLLKKHGVTRAWRIFFPAAVDSQN